MSETVLTCPRCYFMAAKSHFREGLCSTCYDVTQDPESYEVEPDKPRVRLDHTKPGAICRTVMRGREVLAHPGEISKYYPGRERTGIALTRLTD